VTALCRYTKTSFHCASIEALARLDILIITFAVCASPINIFDPSSRMRSLASNAPGLLCRDYCNADCAESPNVVVIIQYGVAKKSCRRRSPINPDRSYPNTDSPSITSCHCSYHNTSHCECGTNIRIQQTIDSRCAYR
jgi:hypothetical protein